MSIVPISKDVNGSTTLDLIQILNDEKAHYVGGFVSTGKCGLLKTLTMNYTCKEDSQNCRIVFAE